MSCTTAEALVVVGPPRDGHGRGEGVTPILAWIGGQGTFCVDDPKIKRLQEACKDRMEIDAADGGIIIEITVKTEDRRQAKMVASNLAFLIRSYLGIPASSE